MTKPARDDRDGRAKKNRFAICFGVKKKLDALMTVSETACIHRPKHSCCEGIVHNTVKHQKNCTTYHLWPEKTGKRIRKFRATVYPSKSAPIATKLCENAFRAIPDISFFDVENFVVAKFRTFFHVFARFLRSYANSDVTSRFLAIFCFRLTY